MKPKQSKLEKLDERIDKILSAPLGYPKPRKRKSERQCLKAECDKLWSKVILARDKHKCQYCGREGNNPHHIYTRSRLNTRFDLDNGICLCALHHTLSSTFSAHTASKNWWPWLDQKKGKQWVDNLEHRSQMDGHGIDLKLIKLFLLQEFKKLT
jgi:hypothetical protein